jgi:hypothetical protein
MLSIAELVRIQLTEGLEKMPIWQRHPVQETVWDTGKAPKTPLENATH